MEIVINVFHILLLFLGFYSIGAIAFFGFMWSDIDNAFDFFSALFFAIIWPFMVTALCVDWIRKNK